MKPSAAQIRVISVDHDRTSLASARLRRALDANGFKEYKVQSVFCHLEAGRCGVASGVAAVEVDGQIVWVGKELTEHVAAAFCDSLRDYIDRQQQSSAACAAAGKAE